MCPLVPSSSGVRMENQGQEENQPLRPVSETPSIDSVTSTIQYYSQWCAQTDLNSGMVECQFKKLFRYNEKKIENFDTNRGQALDNDTASLIFHLCKKLDLDGTISIHSIELHDRWIAYCSREDILPDTEEEMTAEQIKEIFLRVITCIQLASKMVGVIIDTSDLQEALADFNCFPDLEAVIMSEYFVFKYLDFNLKTMTPLEYIPHMLTLLEFQEEQFGNMYSFCVNLTFVTYLERDRIYEDFRGRLDKYEETVFSDEDFTKIKYDMVVRSAAIIQCSMIIHEPTNPKVNLDKLVTLINYSASRDQIFELSLSMFNIFLESE